MDHAEINHCSQTKKPIAAPANFIFLVSHNARHLLHVVDIASRCLSCLILTHVRHRMTVFDSARLRARRQMRFLLLNFVFFLHRSNARVVGAVSPIMIKSFLTYYEPL
jgi:hypothetical protein